MPDNATPFRKFVCLPGIVVLGLLTCGVARAGGRLSFEATDAEPLGLVLLVKWFLH